MLLFSAVVAASERELVVRVMETMQAALAVVMLEMVAAPAVLAALVLVIQLAQAVGQLVILEMGAVVLVILALGKQDLVVAGQVVMEVEEILQMEQPHQAVV
tara:strand:- start:228 stop:533 length:306 start_codon:yes stop_codon:yes gene_type:complete